KCSASGGTGDSPVAAKPGPASRRSHRNHGLSTEHTFVSSGLRRSAEHLEAAVPPLGIQTEDVPMSPDDQAGVSCLQPGGRNGGAAKTAPSPVEPNWACCLAAGGEMGALIGSFDWSSTPLGPISQWPPSLRGAVSICLRSRFQLAIYWGP